MQDVEEKIKKIESEIRKTPYHKGTEHHIGLLKAKLARLKAQIFEKSAKKTGGVGFAIPKQGDATCILVGLASVGKSTILSKLTAAKPKIAPYPFTTLSVIPGVMSYKGAAIQILDVPGLVGGAAEGSGSGREVLSVLRAADLLLIVAECKNFEEQKRQILAELEKTGIRVNQKPPAITIKKLNSGGIKTILAPNSNLSKQQITSISKELGLTNAEIQIKSQVSQEDLIDAILGNRVYIKAIYLASKLDLQPNFSEENVIGVSAENNLGIEQLKEAIWKNLNLIRIYLKPASSLPDFSKPLIIKYKSTIFNAAKKISHELATNLRAGQVFRQNKKKQVGLNFELQDEDVVTFLT